MTNKIALIPILLFLAVFIDYEIEKLQPMTVIEFSRINNLRPDYYIFKGNHIYSCTTNLSARIGIDCAEIYNLSEAGSAR